MDPVQLAGILTYAWIAIMIAILWFFFCRFILERPIIRPLLRSCFVFIFNSFYHAWQTERLNRKWKRKLAAVNEERDRFFTHGGDNIK